MVVRKCYMIEALFGSKTRVKLLHLFMSNPGRSFYVREITRRVDEQINSVRRELANLLSVGVIKSDNSDNKLYYEVNQEYVHFNAFKMIFTSTDHSSSSDGGASSVKISWSKRLKPLGDVKVALLCGSLVRGSMSPVDVLLVGDINRTQAKKFLKVIEEEEGRVLNYTIMSYDDFRYRLEVRDKFITDMINGKYVKLQDVESVLTKK